MDDKVNLAEKLDLLDRPFRPGIVGFLNDDKVVVVKADGEHCPKADQEGAHSADRAARHAQHRRRWSRPHRA